MKLVNRVDSGLRVVTRFAGLNLCWLVFTVLGLGVLGLFPATAALFYIARQWVLGEHDDPLIPLFASRFKAYFIKANMAGWAFAILGWILHLNYQVIAAADGSIPFPVVLCFLLAVALFLMLSASILPIALHYAGTPTMILRKTLYFILGQLPMALVFVVAIWAVGWVSLAFPAFFLFFSGSLTAYALTSLFIQTIERLAPADEPSHDYLK